MTIKEDLAFAIDSANARSLAKAATLIQLKNPNLIIPSMSNPYADTIATYDPLQAVTGFPQWGSLGTTTNKWYGFVAHPNGMLYGIPYNGAQVLEFNPVTKQTTLFGSLGTGASKWMGGAVGQDGKIYCAPFSETRVLVIDVVAKTVTRVGNLSGSSKWVGSVSLRSGNILGIPHNSNNYMVITPGSTQPYTYASGLSGNRKCFGAAYNGTEVFLCPQSQATIRIHNPETNANRDVAIAGATASGWAGSCLTPDGRVIFAPYNAGTVLELDIATNIVRQYGNLGTQSAKYIGFHLAPNGNAYAIPHAASAVLEFNTYTKQIALLGNLPGTTKWAGGGLALDGKIYGCPKDSSRVLEIPIGAQGPNWWALSAYVNKL